MSDPSLSDQSGALAAARRTILIGTGLALLAAMSFGINVPAVRSASQAGMFGADLIFYRALILAVLIGGFALATGQRLALMPQERAPVLRLALAASLTATFYLSALDHLAVPMAVVIFYTFPLIVMLISNRLEGRRLAAKQIGIFAIAFAGLVLAVGPSADKLSLVGVGFAILAALCSAALFILAGNVEGTPQRNLFWTQLVMIPVSLVIALINGGPVPVAVFKAAPIAILIAMVGYALGFFLQLHAARRISASRTGLLFLLEPVTAIVLAGFALGETLRPVEILGVGLILAALAAEILIDTPKAEVTSDGPV
ncbi:MAG: DMT family transporter [Proteobacteria bacterium]|nr:DMT family transporter [Pseudomonadota bacterium]